MKHSLRIMVLCCFALIMTGCALNRQPVAATQRITTLHGTLPFSVRDIWPLSRCAPEIAAILTFDVQFDANRHATGKGRIVYDTAIAGMKRTCSRCELTTENGTFTMDGEMKVNANGESLHATLQPRIAKNPTEFLTASCSNTLEVSSEPTSHLLFALEQSGFLDSWTVDLKSQTSTRLFSLDAPSTQAEGLLTIEKK